MRSWSSGTRVRHLGLRKSNPLRGNSWSAVRLFGGPGEAYADNAAPDPGSCPREYRGSSAGSGFFFVRLVAERHQPKDGESPGRCLTHRDLPGKNRLPRTRDPLLPEEPVMSITAWIVPWPTGGQPARVLAGGRRSQGSVIVVGAALPLDCHLVTGQADTCRRPGGVNR
jgi:hypothetical protein